MRGDPVSGNPRPPPYLSNHAKITSTKLAQEAKETVMAVRNIISVKGKQKINCTVALFCIELPFGWEEKLTEEGEKFYVKYVRNIGYPIMNEKSIITATRTR